MIKDASIYRKVDVQTKVGGASPTRLVQLLYENVLDHLHQSQALLEIQPQSQIPHNEHSKAEQFNNHLIKTIDTITALREALNFDVSTDLPHNLDHLYDYLQRRLLSARLKQDAVVVGECIALTETLKSGWDSLCH